MFYRAVILFNGFKHAGISCEVASRELSVPGLRALCGDNSGRSGASRDVTIGVARE